MWVHEGGAVKAGGEGGGGGGENEYKQNEEIARK